MQFITQIIIYESTEIPFFNRTVVGGTKQLLLLSNRARRSILPLHLIPEGSIELVDSLMPLWVEIGNELEEEDQDEG